VKGVILHGGSGTRLRPFTYTDVKQLLPVAGKPISEYALGNLIEIDIKEINIVIGSVGGEEVQKYYRNGDKWGINITYTYQEKPLGIAHAIGLTRDFVRDDDFVVFLGDNYLNDGISSLYDNYRSDEMDGMLALVKVKNPSQFGIAEVREGKIVRLVEKPKEPKSNLAIAGVYFLKPEIFDVISRLQPSWRGEYEITEAYHDMIDHGKRIGYSIVTGRFKDTGTVDDFLECNRLVLDKIPNDPSSVIENISGKVLIHTTAKVDKNSTILGPCYIGSHSIVNNCYIGPYVSIGANCRVNNADIENSILMDSATVDLRSSATIRNSIIGPNARVSVGKDPKKVIRLILGRDSSVEL
jgi:glucose-1-phosphate thymidylyltransferase